jgi:extracellular elastinolytic metalloproteinase
MQRVDQRGRSRRRAFVAGLTTVMTLVAVLAVTVPARSAGRHVTRRQIQTVDRSGTFDIRAHGTAVRPSVRAVKARTTLARRLGSQSLIVSDDVTGTLRMVGRLDGYLTGPSRRRASDVAMGFVRSNIHAFGLSRADLRTFQLRHDYVDIGGTHHISWTQSWRGISVFHNGLRAAVTKSGRLVNVTGSPVHGLRGSTVRPRIPSGTAITIARADGGARVHAAQRGDSATLTLFATGRGARLAWRTLTWASTRQLNLSVVDAQSGVVLYRQSLTNDVTGTASAWEFYPSSLTPGGNVANTVSFPVEDGSMLLGDNAYVFADVNDNNEPDAGEDIAATSGTDWSIPAVLDTTTAWQNCSAARPCTWSSGTRFSWRANMAQNAAQVMYFLNRFHDHLEGSPYGFTAAAGNFELAGGDPVVANTNDGANTDHGLPDEFHLNNAFMATPPDRDYPLMGMFLFAADSRPFPSANGGDDAEIVYHEYAHGLSNRLVLFPDGTSGLTTQQAGSMGEGWSDWYAEDFLNNEGLKPDSAAVGDVVMGAIVFAGQLRRNPVDCPVGASGSTCPGGADTGAGGFTYGDFGDVAGFPEVHADGEIWLETLWQIRQAIGATTTESLVTRGMELSPPGPSMLDMRNAILQADLVYSGGTNQAALWVIFAERGMGYFASSTGDSVEPIEDFSTPVDCAAVTCGAISGKITDKGSGKGLSGVDVGVAGLNSGFGWDLAATTSSNGTFSITDVPFHTYPLLQVTRKAYEPIDLTNIVVDGDEKVNGKLVRDWAAIEGGAKLGKYSPPDYAPFCGPEFAFDLDLGTGWGSDAVGSDVGSNYTGPRKIIVKLPKAVNISSFAVASDGTCGDDPSAGVKKFKIETKTNNGDWVTAVAGRIDNDGALHVFKPTAGKQGARFVRFIMLSNHGDPLFMDMMELSVRGK